MIIPIRKWNLKTGYARHYRYLAHTSNINPILSEGILIQTRQETI